MARDDRLVQSVTDSVGYTLAGLFFGWAIQAALQRFTPLRSPWWLGPALGAACASAANWKKDND